MSNSTLISATVKAYEGNYTKGRSGKKIQKITIHHMAGVLTAQRCGELFQVVGRRGSAHYGIGNDGKIALYVNEADTAWADSNWDSNCTSVSIEVSNSATGGQWQVSDAALASLVKLVADIAKRNNLGTLVKGKNLTWHQMYAATTCPGPYLISKMDYIVNSANKINSPFNGKLAGIDKARRTNELIVYYKGLTNNGKTGTNKWGAEVAVNSNGVAICDPIYGVGNMDIPAGGFVISGHDVASDWIIKNIKKGNQITINNGVVKVGPIVPITNTPSKLSIGDEVRLVAGAKYTSGGAIPSWITNKTLYVRDIRGNGDVVISTLKTGAVTGVVSSKYITKNGNAVVTPSVPSQPVATPTKFNVGDAVKLVSGARYTSGGTIPSWLFRTTLYVRDIQGENAVISTLKTGAVTGVVSMKYLKK